MNDVAVASGSIFTRDAADYDAMRRRLIPCFDAFYGTALEAIEDWNSLEDPAVLDLGAGTGLFSLMLLGRIPKARIHLVDASDGMLQQARRRFDGQCSVTFALADIAVSELSGPWDLVISALAIHHLEDDLKRMLFARIARCLKPGGLFVNAEQVLGPDAEGEAHYASLWLRQTRALGAPEDEIGRALERMSHDRCATLEAQLQWMREAGFSQVDCIFKSWRFAVITGRT